jgi:gliding motility-associated-like protein
MKGVKGALKVGSRVGQRLLCAIALLWTILPVSAQVSVSGVNVADSLTRLLAGRGVTVTGAVLHCPPTAAGIFRVVSSNLGMDSGIVLTNGLAATNGYSTATSSGYGINGMGNNFANTAWGAPGDADLEKLSGGYPTYDACVLECDLTTQSDTIAFNYVFGSEEYKTATCGFYNDLFQFYLSGPGIAGKEMLAFVPGTKIPVCINSVNSGTPGTNRGDNLSICTALGPGSPFTGYFVSNYAGATITYDGFTTVLQAQHNVIPCAKYHLKFAVADVGDDTYDSGVFLAANSLSSESYAATALGGPGSDTGAPYSVKGCLPGAFIIERSRPEGYPETILLTAAGNAVSGVDYAPLPDSIIIPANETSVTVTVNGLPTALNGPKELLLYIQPAHNCGSTDSAALIIYDTLHLSLPADTLVCNSDTFSVNAGGDPVYAYGWSPAYGLSNPAIADPSIAISGTVTYTVTANIPGSSCPTRQDTIRVSVKPTPSISLPADTAVCFGVRFYFNPVVAPDSVKVSYQWSGPGGFVSTDQNPAVTAGLADSGWYSFMVRNDSDACSRQARIHLSVVVPDTPTVPSPIYICLNSAADTLAATGSDLQWYAFDNPDSVLPGAPAPPVDGAATYLYYVTQQVQGCTSPKALVAAQVLKCCDGILEIPNAFCPGGYNKKFKVIHDYGYVIASIDIYNRWGQLVFHGTGNDEWDGTYLGEKVDVGDYFYHIVVGCINGPNIVRNGDVLVIR